jgi:hypothetical protein
MALIVKDFWQLFSQIFGETSLIVANNWRNSTGFYLFVRPWHPLFELVLNFLAL